MILKLIFFSICILLIGCGISRDVKEKDKWSTSKYSLDSMRVLYPSYIDSTAKDSVAFFLINYIGGVKIEMLGFDSLGNYKFYMFYKKKQGLNVYGTIYNDSLNVLKEEGRLFYLIQMSCFEKENDVIFSLYPVSPPFFSTHFELKIRDTSKAKFTTNVDKELHEDHLILYEDSSFVNGREYMGIVTLYRENFEKKDTFNIKINECLD